MMSQGSSEGFSPYVSFILISSNLIRLFWWYLDRFSVILFLASILMVGCQCTLLYFWVKLKNQAHIKKQKEQQALNRDSTQTESSMIDTTDAEPNKEEDLEEFESSFWYWNKFSNYVWCILTMIAAFAALTWLGQDSKTFSDSIGMLSSGIEALLGVPQFWLNFGKKNTAGLSISLIVLWLFGDLYKMSYYQQTEAPTQLLLCAVFQVCTDISILSQFWVYR